MKVNNLFSQLQRRHLCIAVITLLFLWVWYLCFPCQMCRDFYGNRMDQWGVGPYLLIQIANLPLTLTEWSITDRQSPITSKCFIYFGGCMATLAHAALLWYSLVSMTSTVCRHLRHPWFFVIAVAGMILTGSFLLFSKTIDLFFCATAAWVLSKIVKKDVIGGTFTLRELCMLIIVSAVAVSYRKNALIIMPLLVWMCLSLYHPARLWRPLKRLIVCCIVAVVAAFPLSSSVLVPVLDLQEMHGEEVFQSSDYALMCMLKGKPIELQQIEGTMHDDGRYLFMQHYANFGQGDNIRKQWIAEIKDSPSTFLKVRSINFLQFMTIGCMPDFINEALQKRYPEVYFPGTRDYREMVYGFNFPINYNYAKEIKTHSISEFKGWGGILEFSTV